jgi:cell division protein FtsL
MKADDSTEQAKQRSLEAIEVRLARHEKVTRFTLTMVVILAGLALALLATHLFDLPI